jgi:soluble P-type ATPase
MLFTKPTNLNGAELTAELLAVGVEIERITIEADGQMKIQIIAGDEKKAQKVVASHDGSTVAPEPTIADKLASVGLSIDELKTAILS